MLIAKQDLSTYYYNQSDSFNRQRFTKAHELGHLVFEHTVFKDKFYDDFKGDFDDPLKKKLTSFHLKS